MLGIRLPADAEERARAIGRGKSVVAREWILERLERESVDDEMRRAAEIVSRRTSQEESTELNAAADEWLRMLDEEDGGYDWGPKGPPG
jgi:hypothetical protein